MAPARRRQLETPARRRQPLRRPERVTDRAIGIALGIVVGILIVIAFVFLGSEETIDDPSVNEGETPTVTQPAPEPTATAP